MAYINVKPAAAPTSLEDDPTLAGFTAWVFTFMGVPAGALPVDSPFLQLAYDQSLNIAYIGLKAIRNRSVQKPQSPSIYSIAVYNLAGHFLVNLAMDDPNADPPQDPPHFWAELRSKLNLNSFSYGMMTSASDQGTSASQQIPNIISDMSLFNMWLLQTPWGRMYAMIAGQWGTVWGIS